MATTIRRIYNGQARDFDRDLLEAAWLARADVAPDVAPVQVNTVAAARLRDELGWGFGAAAVYVAVASNWDGKD